MDMELCQLRPAYFYRLQQYNAALKQRTALLKTSFPFEPNIELLDMWDDKLAELGGSVMLLRRDFLDRLSTAARDLNRSITGNSSVGHEPEELFTYYKPSVPSRATVRAPHSGMHSARHGRRISAAAAQPRGRTGTTSAFCSTGATSAFSVPRAAAHGSVEP